MRRGPLMVLGLSLVMLLGANEPDGCDSRTDAKRPCSVDEDCEGGSACWLNFCLPPVMAVDMAVVDACSPTMEVCNGVDDDCDGVSDDLPILGQPCFEDPRDPSRVVPEDRRMGPCAEGRWVCSEGMLQCDGLVLPTIEDFCLVDTNCNGRIEQNGNSVEVCDGADNDCDGVIDTDTPGLGDACFTDPADPARSVSVEQRVGVCAMGGVATCVAGVAGCEGLVLPGSEETEATRCNGLDDDCDGMEDEAYPAGMGCMSEGVGACIVAGTLRCQGGSEACVNGQGGAVVPRAAVVEVCNAVDDDCDGTVDNGCACSEGEGEAGIVAFTFSEATLPAGASPVGLEGNCTLAGQQEGPSERDETVVSWTPAVGDTRLALISVSSDAFDPQVYLRSPCHPVAVGGGVDGVEQGCALDSGVFGGEGSATMMVEVPVGAGAGSIVVESQGEAAAGAEFVVRVSDPTWRSVVGRDAVDGYKRLFVGEAVGGELVGVGDGARCEKRIASGGAEELPVFGEVGVDEVEVGWQRLGL